ncbi:MAG: hypothetical protein LQ345_003769 [Seirophora villosa]|nr:MAG: hypothetical protein LQ345_003769 [Seirophora villosa]
MIATYCCGADWKDPSEYEVQMDQQIQTPNEQTDLDTVEQLMRNHKSVDDAAAVFRDGPDPEIVGFVTLQQSAIESQIGSQRHAGEEYETQQVYQGTATDLHLLGSASPNVVVINSVAQYFPSSEYLLEVVEGISHLDSVQSVLFGDMRSYALQKEFLVSRALYKSGAKASRDEVREEMTEMAQAELELLTDPGFFTSLPSRFPDLIEHVEILPKRMRASNELSCYRYAAILHIRNRTQMVEQQQQEILEEAGYRVEISWARQHSQRGGFDAVFHHYQPPSGGRVLFRFPTDHQARAPSTFNNQPLQQQAKQTIQQQLYETLQAQLPLDLMPDDILILEKFPINADGEVDRQALAKKT